MHSTIFFKIEKTVEAKDRLLTVMANTVNDNVKAERHSYLQTSIDQLKDNDEVKSLVRQLADTEKIKVSDVKFEPIIQVIKNDANWMFDQIRHSYHIKMTMTSVEYGCFHVLDENNFLCYAPGELKELKKITVTTNMKAYAK